MIKPNPTTGMRHVAFFVRNFEATEKFYVELLGMEVEWRPDDHSVYLTSGNDNLALHHTEKEFSEAQHLDHIGFFLNVLEDVDEWFDFLRGHDIKMKTNPKTHRDGARSFYCFDPDGNTVQMIFHPPQQIREKGKDKSKTRRLFLSLPFYLFSVFQIQKAVRVMTFELRPMSFLTG